MSQYLWIITAPDSWKSASVVATAAHVMQKPDPFLVPFDAGRVSNAFIIVYFTMNRVQMSCGKKDYINWALSPVSGTAMGKMTVSYAAILEMTFKGHVCKIEEG